MIAGSSTAHPKPADACENGRIVGSICSMMKEATRRGMASPAPSPTKKANEMRLSQTALPTKRVIRKRPRQAGTITNHLTPVSGGGRNRGLKTSSRMLWYQTRASSYAATTPT